MQMIPGADKKELIELADRYGMEAQAEEARNERDSQITTGGIVKPAAKFEFQPFKATADEALANVIRNAALQVEKLTTKQLTEAFKQAVECGDFVRHVRAGDHAQQVVYMPGEGIERAKTEAVKRFKQDAWLVCEELLTQLAIYDADFFRRHGGAAVISMLKPTETE